MDLGGPSAHHRGVGINRGIASVVVRATVICVLVGVLVGPGVVASGVVASGVTGRDGGVAEGQQRDRLAASIAALRADVGRATPGADAATFAPVPAGALTVSSTGNRAESTRPESTRPESTRESTRPESTRPEGSVTIADSIGDSYWYRGDLVRAAATMSADGSTSFVASVALFDSPYSASWHFRDTGIVWSIDTDLDGDEDRAAVMINVDGDVVAGVLDAGDDLMCDADVTWDAAASSYGVAFATSCIGNPASFQWEVGMSYEDYATVVQSTDWAPDLSWAPPVGNEAVGAPPVPSSPLSSPASSFAACSAIATTTTTTTTDGFTSLVPARLIDTRLETLTVDCQDAGLGLRNAGSTTSVRVTGRGGVSASSTAVVLNVTVDDPQAAGYVTVFPCGEPRPVASSLNYTARTTVANAVVARVGAGGNVCFFTTATTELIVDVNGSFAAGSSFVALTPQRLVDSRTDAAGVTVPVRAAGSVTEVQVAGAAGVAVDAVAAVLNVTATGSQSGGFVTVFPCGAERPNASSLNHDADDTVANAVVAKIGAGGRVCLYSNAGTHLVVDVNGYYVARTAYVSFSPSRLLDSRAGGNTLDGREHGIGIRPAGTVTPLDVAGRSIVPIGATTVVLNVTVTDPQGGGFVTVFPCGTTRPNASSLNFEAGETVANAVVAKVGVGGRVCFVSNVATHLVVDVNGYYA